MNREQITSLVLDVLVEAIEETEREVPEGLTGNTRLFGEGGIFDSLGLVSFLVDVEDRLSDELEIEINLSDEKALSAKRGPFRSVDIFVDHILSLLAGDEE